MGRFHSMIEKNIYKPLKPFNRLKPVWPIVCWYLIMTPWTQSPILPHYL